MRNIVSVVCAALVVGAWTASADDAVGIMEVSVPDGAPVPFALPFEPLGDGRPGSFLSGPFVGDGDAARSDVSSPRLRLSLCWWGEEWQDEGLVKRASAADFVNVGGLLTEGEVSRDGRGRTVEEAVPEGAARSAEADSTVRPRPKFFPPFSDLGLTRPSPFPRGTRRASCSRAFRAACGCCISRSRASPPQSPRPSCGSSSRGNIRP